MLILVGNKRNDRQPMPVLKRADVTTETVRVLSTVGTMLIERTGVHKTKA